MRNSSLAILHTICQSLFGLLPLKLKKRLGDCTDFFFHFVRTLLRKNTKAQKAASIICIQSDFFKMKINREIYSPTRSLWIRPESLFLFFQYQGLRVIFVRQHSLFEFEGLFQLGVYNLIIVIQTLRNKAMNRGTFWKGVWVVFIVFFSLSSWGFFLRLLKKAEADL